MQQGGSPSPFDRNFGTKMGVKVYKWIIEKLSEERKITPADKDTACLLGKEIQIIHTKFVSSYCYVLSTPQWITKPAT